MNCRNGCTWPIAALREQGRAPAATQGGLFWQSDSIARIQPLATTIQHVTAEGLKHG